MKTKPFKWFIFSLPTGEKLYGEGMIEGHKMIAVWFLDINEMSLNQ